MARDRSSFIFYHDWLEVFKSVKPDVAIKLLEALVGHSSSNGNETDNPLMGVAFSAFKPQLDRDMKRWEAELKQRAAAGKKGGKQKQANRLKIVPNGSGS